MKTLQELCIDSILHHPKFRTLEGMLLLFSSRIDFDLPSFSPIKQMAENNIREFFPFLLDKIGLHELKSHFPTVDWDEYYQNYLHLQEEKKYFQAMKGTIIEREEVIVDSLSDTYPYHVLKAGMKWPSNVDPAHRENYLSDEDFLQIFKMTKEEFRQQPNFVRKRMKVDKGLF